MCVCLDINSDRPGHSVNLWTEFTIQFQSWPVFWRRILCKSLACLDVKPAMYWWLDICTLLELEHWFFTKRISLAECCGVCVSLKNICCVSLSFLWRLNGWRLCVCAKMHRDIPMPLVSSGVEHGNLRELALARLEDWGSKCRDVRTREVGIQEIHHRVRPYEVHVLFSQSSSALRRCTTSCTSVFHGDEKKDFVHCEGALLPLSQWELDPMKLAYNPCRPDGHLSTC